MRRINKYSLQTFNEFCCAFMHTNLVHSGTGKTKVSILDKAWQVGHSVDRQAGFFFCAFYPCLHGFHGSAHSSKAYGGKTFASLPRFCIVLINVIKIIIS